VKIWQSYNGIPSSQQQLTDQSNSKQNLLYAHRFHVMSASRTYRPRRQQRQPSCAYCKELGHWMKHRDGTPICPKLQEKARRKQANNHRAAQNRRVAVAAGHWVAAQSTGKATQPRKRSGLKIAQNRFELPSSSDEESDDEIVMERLPVTRSKPAQGAWAAGVNQAVKTEGEVKPSPALLQKQRDEEMARISKRLAAAKAELGTMDHESTNWAVQTEIDELEDEIEELEGKLTIFLC